jgi:DNA-directed RNA polymerase specialized sigma24 family protein
MQQVEEEIKKSFMRRGKTNLWMDFLRERNRIVAQNKADELEAEKVAAKRKKEIEEAITMVLLLIAAAGLIALVAWGTMEYVAFMKA